MIQKRRLHIPVSALFLATIVALPGAASAAEKKKAAAAPEPSAPASAEAEAGAAERVNVDAIKEKYWANGEETEVSVVQNRTYSKAKKFEGTLFLGASSTDPFLTTNPAGFSFGYHFNEYISAHALYFRTAVKPSDANRTLEGGGKKANTNPPKSYMGGEVSASLLYGKLSVIGKAIIYYDLHFLGGLGATDTENGKYFTWHAGLGQQFFLSQRLSLRVDYRLMSYKEDIKEKEITARLGQVVGNRNNLTNVITLGLSILIGGN